MDISNHTHSTLSRSNSKTSSNSELEKELINLEISSATTNGQKNGTSTHKKRISSSRTPTRKAKRLRFYRNGDRFFSGIVIPVSNEKYRSFESLSEDLTRILEDNVKLPGAVRTIYSLAGKKISTIDEFEDGSSYICSCNSESFKKVEYSSTPVTTLKTNNRLSKIYRPSSPLKSVDITNSSQTVDLNERNSVVFPRIVTLIRNGTKPRKIMRLLLNKRNSPTFNHVLSAITHIVRLDSGCVRKAFTISGTPVLTLGDFFAEEDVFFAYGTERVNPEDFRLEADEQKAVQVTRKTLKTGAARSGPKPEMPLKSHLGHNVTYSHIEETFIENGMDMSEIPQKLEQMYVMEKMIGDGNFAIVLKIQNKTDNKSYALKIIDKSKCKGKEHYIIAEVRVMKQLNHPHIISLITDMDTPNYMYLVLEYVSGGDLFDAITRVTRFSEDQSRVMLRNLAAAMAYLHSLGIVHRDIKPENLLVELDADGMVIDLKLADFGLACEVDEPLLAVCGTPTYVAPEILMETGYGLKIDVWAAGVILYILLCGFPPFVSPNNQQEPLFDAILSGVYEFPEPYWNDIGNTVRDLISNMLQADPELRFSSEDILDHYWMDEGLR